MPHHIIKCPRDPSHTLRSSPLTSHHPIRPSCALQRPRDPRAIEGPESSRPTLKGPASVQGPHLVPRYSFTDSEVELPQDSQVHLTVLEPSPGGGTLGLVGERHPARATLCTRACLSFHRGTSIRRKASTSSAWRSTCLPTFLNARCSTWLHS